MGADTDIDHEQLREVADVLRKAESALFVTGAGISADSGLPTYRGIGGLYHDADVDEGIPIEVALSAHTFRRNPELSWKYIHQIEEACRGARHNTAHEVIAKFERELERAWVLTQNVDGFHRDAGSEKLIEIHGNVHDLKCTQCRWHERVPDFSSLAMPPQCLDCHAIIRPDVVLFGEMLPSSAVSTLERELARGFDVVFSVGTSSLFPYIAQPMIDAHLRGIPTVEINPDRTDVSSFARFGIRARAKPALEALWKVYQEGR